jgi:fucose permease
MPFRGVYVLVATILWAVMALAATGGEDAPVRRAARAHGEGGRFGLFRDRALLLLATITALAFLYEGMMETWSVIYLRDSLALPALVGASGAAVFHLAMMTGRFGTAGAVVRFGRPPVLRAAGVLAAVGMLLALATEAPVAVLAGFLAVGLALSGVAPITFSLAGDRAPERAGEASSVITTLGYGGFLLGPSLIGGLAELTGLRLALATGCLMGVAIAVLAGRIGRPSSSG